MYSDERSAWLVVTDEGSRLRIADDREGSRRWLTLETYLTNNLDRMDYTTYRSRGLRVTTVTVESGNDHMTGVHLKGQGMRWGKRGATHMATLRADLCDGDWDRRTWEILDAAA